MSVILIRLRTGTRKLLQRPLTLVPLTVVDHIRRRYASAARTSVRRKVLSLVLVVLRHRPLEDVPEFTVSNRAAVRLVTADSLLVRSLFWFGEVGYEGIEAEWWRRCSRAATNILELGANVGYYTVIGAMANPDAKYVAVEPHPVAARLARRNLALNGVSHVELLEVAVVGRRSGDTIELALPDLDAYAAPTGAFIRQRAEGIGRRSASTGIEVAVMEMADLVEGVDLLKLDIEGLEAEVLEAVLDRLRQHRPTIFVEMLPEADRLRRLVRSLCADGYVAHAIGPSSLHLLARSDLDAGDALAQYDTRDVLLTPSERIAQL